MLASRITLQVPNLTGIKSADDAASAARVSLSHMTFEYARFCLAGRYLSKGMQMRRMTNRPRGVTLIQRSSRLTRPSSSSSLSSPPGINPTGKAMEDESSHRFGSRNSNACAIRLRPRRGGTDKRLAQPLQNVDRFTGDFGPHPPLLQSYRAAYGKCLCGNQCRSSCRSRARWSVYPRRLGSAV